MKKLTGQYWENLERMRYRRDNPVKTWEGMKEKLMLKYVQIRSTFPQSAVIEQVQQANLRKQVSHRLITKFDE